jgi:ribose 5-phosphate isomerase A
LTDVEAKKRRAAARAVAFIENGMRLGLGSGSTARHVVEIVARKLDAGELRDIVGVPTSRSTEALAAGLGIPLLTLDEQPRLDLTIDGADEVNPALDVIKGLGGALLWEKIVARASDRLVIVVDESKLVTKLGERAPLPVEVVPFGWTTHMQFFKDLGADPRVRTDDVGAPFRTDSGNLIVDCGFESGIPSARDVERSLNERAGVVESGLFLGMATAVVVAGDDDARVLERPAS